MLNPEKMKDLSLIMATSVSFVTLMVATHSVELVYLKDDLPISTEVWMKTIYINMVILSKEFIPTRSKNAQKSTPPKPSFDSSFLIHFSLIKPIYAIVHVFLCVRQNKEN